MPRPRTLQPLELEDVVPFYPTKPINRRYWNLQVLRTLSRYGVELAIVRQTIGTDAFNHLLDEAFADAPLDPDKGAMIMFSNMHRRLGREWVQSKKLRVRWNVARPR